MMKDVSDFLRAALPWVAAGLLLAIWIARGEEKQKKKERTDDYGTEGMCLGMCIGSAIGVALGNHIGLGIFLGMLIGLVVGSGIKKEEQGDDKKE